MRTCVFFAVLGVVAIAPPTTLHAAPVDTGVPDAKFVPIFNGEDLTGWRGLNPHRPAYDKFVALPSAEREKLVAEWTEDARKHWSVEHGELVNDGHGAYLATNKDYGDYILKIEYKTVPKADSGIYLKGVPQVQIWDSTNPAKSSNGEDKGSGGLWNNSKGAPGKDPLVVADRPFGEWNSFVIIQTGARTTV
ncbi:MAG: DUF1080 domain-containing protein, partial [Isosphaeraceae bacterium]